MQKYDDELLAKTIGLFAVKTLWSGMLLASTIRLSDFETLSFVGMNVAAADLTSLTACVMFVKMLSRSSRSVMKEEE